MNSHTEGVRPQDDQVCIACGSAHPLSRKDPQDVAHRWARDQAVGSEHRVRLLTYCSATVRAKDPAYCSSMRHRTSESCKDRTMRLSRNHPGATDSETLIPGTKGCGPQRKSFEVGSFIRLDAWLMSQNNRGRKTTQDLPKSRDRGQGDRSRSNITFRLHAWRVLHLTGNEKRCKTSQITLLSKSCRHSTNN